MADIQRISAQEAHSKTKANQALLVCAYDDEAKCRMLNLEGSIFKPTVVGEAFFKTTYGVRKGTKTPSSDK